MDAKAAEVPQADKDVLRGLAGEVAEIAALPVQQEKAEMWRRLNRLDSVRPMVWINEVCWEEIEGGEELQLRCTETFCRSQEQQLRRLLYQWRHMSADMTVDAKFWCDLVIRDSGYGMQANEVRPEHRFGAADYVPVIRSPRDVEKIRTPRITVDRGATDRKYELMRDIYEGVMPVEKRGVVSFWMAPWDVLVRWYGISELYADMYERPELVHMAIDRLVEAMNGRLDQLERQNAVSLNNCGVRVGAGGLGWSDELPQPDAEDGRVRLIDVWGNSTPQIFAQVSPEMHEEFALQYERRFLKRFGLNCYGCCEPLHKKVHILQSIPRLRRISMSPWVDLAEGAAAVGDRYVFSYKPNPAVLAGDKWDPGGARGMLIEAMEVARGCHVEIIMKDISTLRGEPRRLWEWSRIAMEVAEDFSR